MTEYQDRITAYGIQSDEIINIVFIIDVSPSVKDYIRTMSQHFNEFLEHFQNSHHSSKIYVKIITFDKYIHELWKEFRPIRNISDQMFRIENGNGSTAFFDAVIVANRSLHQWNQEISEQGIESKNLIFAITDGQDNASNNSPIDVKQSMNFIREDDMASSLASVFIGVDSQIDWNQYSEALGFDLSTSVGRSPKEIRKMIDIISQSVSASIAAEDLDSIDLSHEIDF